ncbi:MAG: hypothetical protein ACRDRP_22480 [Pseudonocardiaceae bacterium]
MQLFLHRQVHRGQHVGDVAPGGAGTEQVAAFVAAVRDLGADRFGDVGAAAGPPPVPLTGTVGA